jgi:TatD DNase family protein
MQLVDTHVHLNFDVFDADLDAVRERWREAGIVQLVHSCVQPDEFDEIRAIADRVPELSFAVGLHPLDADRWTANSLTQIRNCAQSDGRVVAIGELGLDFFKADNQDHQRQVCRQQLELAIELDLPVIIHCRDAAEAMRDLLMDVQQTCGPLRGVMHCWSGTPTETQWFLDLGFYISFSGIVTFKNAHAIKASAQGVPSDRLLVETDCPFLAPVPRRGKRNEPSNVYYVAAALAELREVDLRDLAATTTANARHLFRLPASPLGA